MRNNSIICGIVFMFVKILTRNVTCIVTESCSSYV
jgi:hypothetical protein